MARTCMVLVMIAALGLLDCGGDGDNGGDGDYGGVGDNSEHCRIYLVEDVAGEDFTGLRVVESPNNGDWGSNLIFSVEEEFINDNWRVFRFPAGTVYDMKLEYRTDIPDTLEETGQQCVHGMGIKYDIDQGMLLTTDVTFD